MQPISNPQRPRSQATMIGVILGVLVLVGAGVTAMLMMNRNDSGTPVATQPAAPARPEPKILPGPDLTADAADMINLFKEKQVDAEAKFNGKVIDVTGSISAKIEGSLDGTRSIALEGGIQRFAGVRCVMNEANFFQLADVDRGDTVTIRGRCEGVTSDVVLRDCAVIKKLP